MGKPINHNGVIHSIVLLVLCLIALFMVGIGKTAKALEPFLEREQPLDMFRDAPTVDLMSRPDPRIIAIINKDTVDTICSEIEQDETFVMVSRGGSIIQGMRLGKCLADANASIIVVRANSIAPIVALHAANVCLTSAADIDVHRPGYGGKKTMPRMDMLKYYGYIQRQSIEHGVPKMAVNMYLEYSEQSPNSSTVPIPRAVFAAMLGSRFRGVCDMSIQSQLGLRNFIDKRFP